MIVSKLTLLLPLPGGIVEYVRFASDAGGVVSRQSWRRGAKWVETLVVIEPVIERFEGVERERKAA